LAPIQVNKINVPQKIKNVTFLVKYILDLLNFRFEVKGRVKIIKIERNRARTPPNLLGIDRRIAYANRKYHSGWIWGGVTMGLAGVKFSGSLKRNGVFRLINKNERITMMNPIKSLIVKYGWKLILSTLFFNPRGFDEPLSWRKIRWNMIMMHKINGRIKWNEKNRFKVGFSTENPPQIQATRVFPR
jgi:hypothetical protein